MCSRRNSGLRPGRSRMRTATDVLGIGPPGANSCPRRRPFSTRPSPVVPPSSWRVRWAASRGLDHETERFSRTIPAISHLPRTPANFAGAPAMAWMASPCRGRGRAAPPATLDYSRRSRRRRLNIPRRGPSGAGRCHWSARPARVAFPPLDCRRSEARLTACDDGADDSSTARTPVLDRWVAHAVLLGPFMVARQELESVKADRGPRGGARWIRARRPLWQCVPHRSSVRRRAPAGQSSRCHPR